MGGIRRFQTPVWTHLVFPTNEGGIKSPFLYHVPSSSWRIFACQWIIFVRNYVETQCWWLQCLSQQDSWEVCTRWVWSLLTVQLLESAVQLAFDHTTTRKAGKQRPKLILFDLGFVYVSSSPLSLLGICPEMLSSLWPRFFALNFRFSSALVCLLLCWFFSNFFANFLGL